MAIGTITKVFEKSPEKNWPGSVVFSDGKKLSTFDDAVVATALNGIGQLAEYEIEISKGKNGKVYENLKSLTLKGAAPVQPQQAREPAKIVDFGGAVVASAVKDLTAAVRELTSALGRVDLRKGPGTERPAPHSEPQPEQLVIDPMVAAEEKLAKAVESPEAARAMFDAMRKKHKDPAKLAEAVAKCLKAHGIEG